MNAQTVTVQTARKLAAAGFPQPSPAPGQWWNIASEFVFVSESRTKYFTVVRYFPGARPLVDEYFDLQDFAGLAYLPTVGDIIRELGAWKYLHIRDSAFLVSIECHLGTISHIRHLSMEYNEHEAAALAWLSLNSNPADLDDF
mgnify:CR=1 FL=1